jgi:hypothetical protein
LLDHPSPLSTEVISQASKKRSKSFLQGKLDLLLRIMNEGQQESATSASISGESWLT